MHDPPGVLRSSPWPTSWPVPGDLQPPNINVVIGGQTEPPQPPPEPKESTGEKLWMAILLGAVPSILAGIVIYYWTRDKKAV